MHAQRVYILNKAYGNNIIIRIPHNFQFQLLPAQDGLFYQHLPHQAGLQAPGTDGLEFFYIVD